MTGEGNGGGSSGSEHKRRASMCHSSLTPCRPTPPQGVPPRPAYQLIAAILQVMHHLQSAGAVVDLELERRRRVGASEDASDQEELGEGKGGRVRVRMCLHGIMYCIRVADMGFKGKRQAVTWGRTGSTLPCMHAALHSDHAEALTVVSSTLSTR